MWGLVQQTRTLFAVGSFDHAAGAVRLSSLELLVCPRAGSRPPALSPALSLRCALRVAARPHSRAAGRLRSPAGRLRSPAACTNVLPAGVQPPGMADTANEGSWNMSPFNGEVRGVVCRAVWGCALRRCSVRECEPGSCPYPARRRLTCLRTLEPLPGVHPG